MEYAFSFLKVLTLVMCAWATVNFKPLQTLSDWAADTYGFCNHFLSPLVSCYWCSTFWWVVLGLYFNLELHPAVITGLYASFIVKQIVIRSNARKLNA